MKYCVYTVLTSAYEEFNSQPFVAKGTNLPFICFTDSDMKAPNGWEFRKIKPIFPQDPVRSQREIKIRPHRYLPEYDGSLYLDNSVLLKSDPSLLIDKVGDKIFSLPFHSFRKDLLSEFYEVLVAGLDYSERILEQFGHYYKTNPSLMQSRPYFTGILLRHHNDLRMIEFAEAWGAQVNRYSRRDQLSINYALSSTELQPENLNVDCFNSWLHAWPNTRNRKDSRRVASQSNGFQEERQKLYELVKNNSLGDDIKSLFSAQLISTNILLAQNKINKKFDTDPDAIERAARRMLSAVVKCHNERIIFVNPGDARAQELKKHNGNLNPDSLNLWRHLIGLDQWTDIIDIGANYGEMLTNVDLPNFARITACECNPEILPYLEGTLRLLPVKVRLVREAISSHPGKIDFLIDAAWSGKSKIKNSEKYEPGAYRSVEVHARTLESILSHEGVEPAQQCVLLKIDVEGKEVDVLEGIGVSGASFSALHIMLETIHLDDGQLDVILKSYILHLYDLQRRSLVETGCVRASDYRKLIDSGKYYKLDSVLTRRQFQG